MSMEIFHMQFLGTVSFHLTRARGRPLSEYEVVRNEDGTYKYQEVFLQQNSYYLIFNFVRGDGTKSDLNNYRTLSFSLTFNIIIAES